MLETVPPQTMAPVIVKTAAPTKLFGPPQIPATCDQPKSVSANASQHTQTPTLNRDLTDSTGILTAFFARA